MGNETNCFQLSTASFSRTVKGCFSRHPKGAGYHTPTERPQVFKQWTPPLHFGGAERNTKQIVNTSLLSKSSMRAPNPGQAFENIRSRRQKPLKSHLYSQREKAACCAQRAFLMDTSPDTFQLSVELSPASHAEMFLQSWEQATGS